MIINYLLLKYSFIIFDMLEITCAAILDCLTKMHDFLVVSLVVQVIVNWRSFAFCQDLLIEVS